MDSERDVTRIVRSWLREDGHESADRVLDDVLALLDTNTQGLSWWQARRIAGVRNLTTLAIAAAAVVVVAVVGINLLPSFGGVGGPVASTSTPPSPSPAPAVQGTPGPESWSAIEPGSYVIGTPQMRIRLTMPAGWKGDETGIGLFPGRWTGMLGLAPTPHEVKYVVTDVCAGEADIDLVAVGPKVDDLVTALVNQTGIERSGPTDVTLGGYPARKFVLNLLPACPARDGLWTDASRTYGFGLRHGETGTVYVVDVNGDRLVIWSAYMNGASAEHIAQLEAITASIQIEPVPNPEPLADVGPGGWLPIGRHALTVDGVPFSFSLPALAYDRGWARYRDIYISKDTVGPQGAEAAIYWTAFPDGEHADPCADLLELTPRATISDLAAVVSTAPGTELVAGPAAATVGGRPARHVVVTVRDDFGCDPGHFFTWDPAEGGPAWWTTNAGDTINVWIVNVDGELFVIVGETTTDASAKLEQELQDIVASIQFE
jgi:hypothetical protein